MRAESFLIVQIGRSHPSPPECSLRVVVLMGGYIINWFSTETENIFAWEP